MYMISWYIDYSRSANKTMETEQEVENFLAGFSRIRGSVFRYTPDPSGISVLTHVRDFDKK
jgi:hypothetical protein